MKTIEIDQHLIGDGQPAFIIGEIGLNHNGSVDIAKQLIDVAAESGADCVKFQKRHVDGLAIQPVLDAKDDRFPEFGSTYRQIREHIEFNKGEYEGLMAHAKARKITFLCTAFDVPSVEFLESINVCAYKIASHSVTNLPLLRKLAHVGKPVIISSGMCRYDELDQAIDALKGNVPLALLHCVSSYPQAVEESNLKLIKEFEKRYEIPIGYSGHELGHFPTLLSIAMGAKIIERHITLDAGMMGFDHKLSLDPKGLAAMVKDIRQAEQALGSGEKFVSEREQITRDKYHVSIASACDIKAGEDITESKLEFKNPGTGLPPSRVNEFLDKKAAKDIPKDTLLTLEMVKGNQ